MHFKNIVSAAAQDGLGFVTGFPAVITGAALLSATTYLLPKMRFLLARSYLDWELKDWYSIYRSETPVEIIHHGERLALPQVLILDNTYNTLTTSNIQVTIDHTPFMIQAAIRSKTEEAFNAYQSML